MKKLTITQINNLQKGDYIVEDRLGEMYRYEGMNNGHIWEFSGFVFEDNEDMNGHFDYEKTK